MSIQKKLIIVFLHMGIVIPPALILAQNQEKIEQYKKACEYLRQEYSFERVAQEKIEVTWEDLQGMATPMSNRVAIQERYHRDVVFVQPEMTIALGREDTSLGIGFALDNPLAFPDFHTNVSQKLHQGYLPIVESQWQMENLEVEQTALAFLPFEDEVVTGKEKQYVVLQIRIQNQTAAAQTADLLVLLCPHLDGTQSTGLIYDTFTTPVSRWQQEQVPVKLVNQSLQWDDKVLLTYQCDKSVSATFHPEYTPKSKTEDQPDRLTNCLQFTLNLAAHETQTMDLVLPGTSALYPVEERESMAKISFSSAMQRACDHWNNALKPAMKFTVPEERLNLIYKQAILSNLQHVIQNPDQPWREPLQTLPTTMVWPWEAADMAVPMISIGLHREFEPCLRYYTLRQVRVGPYSADEAPVSEPLCVKLFGPIPQRPDGDILSAKGAYIGLNPFWMCDTGSVLYLMAQYYRYTRDNDWLNQNAPSILAAWEFIQNARNQTRIVNDQGEKVDHYGLMPKGRPHDWYGWRYHYSFTDSFTWRGMADMATAFALAQRPEAKQMQADAEEYRQILLAVIDKVQFTDPDTGILFTPNTVYYRQGPEHRGGVWLGDGPITLFSTGLLPATDPRFDAMVEYINKTTGHLMGLSLPMEGSTWYLGNNDSTRFMNYLQRGEFEKALLVFYGYVVYGFSRDTLQSVERVDIFNDAYTPLQPNASANGRYINMLRRMVIDEQEPGKLWLLRGCPRRWFAPGKEIVVTDAPTLFGKMAVRTKAEGQTITVDIDAPDRQAPDQIKLVVRHPQQKRITSVTVNGKETKVINEVIVLTKPAGRLTVVCTY